MLSFCHIFNRSKDMGENVCKSAFFGFFGYFRPLNVIFRDSPTELPLILKLIKFWMRHKASFIISSIVQKIWTKTSEKKAFIWAILGSFGPKMQSFRDHQVTTLFEDYQILSFRNAISFLIKQRTVWKIKNKMLFLLISTYKKHVLCMKL